MTYIGHKYSSARDEVLHAMSVQGWANRSDGNVEAPTGFFAIISNSPAELAEVVAAFDEEIEGTEDSDFSTSELVGHFVLVEDSQGFVGVYDYSTELGARVFYDELEDTFSKWDEEEL
mgnify:CR=1 FL=1